LEQYLGQESPSLHDTEKYKLKQSLFSKSTVIEQAEKVIQHPKENAVYLAAQCKEQLKRHNS